MKENTFDFEGFFEAAEELFCICTTEGGFLRVNKNWEKTFGYSSAELEGASMFDFVHPDDSDYSYELKKKISETKSLSGVLNRFRTKKGDYLLLEWNANLVGDCYFCSAHDVTERVEMQKRLKESEGRYRIFTDNMVDALWVIDAETLRFVFVTPNVKDILGYTSEEIHGKEIQLVLTPGSMQKALETLAESVRLYQEKGISSKIRIVLEHIKKNQEIIWAEVTSTLFMDDEGRLTVVGVSRDISDRMKVEQQLRESEANFRFLTDNMIDVIWLLDVETKKFKYISPGWHYLTGYTPEEAIAMGLEKIITPESFKTAYKNIERMTEEFLKDGAGKPQVSILQFYKRDGTFLDAEVVSSVSKNEEGRLQITGVTRDVSQRLKAEKALKESELHYRNLIHSQTNFMLRTNLNGNILFWNDKFDRENSRIYGSNGIFNSPFRLSVASSHHEQLDKAMRECIAEPGKIISVGLDKPEADGAIRTTLWEILCISDDDHRPVELQFVGIDITSRKQATLTLRKQKEQLEKLIAEKDKFFSIISHDLRSPFHGFLAMLEILNNEYDDMSTEEVKKILKSLNEGGVRLYTLLENLLQWSSLQQNRMRFDPAVYDIYKLAVNTMEIMKSAAESKEIKLTIEGKKRMPVTADKPMIETVLRNLLSNAFKFTHRGGRVTITIVDESDTEVRVAVSDTGIGMNEELLGKLFKLNEKISRLGTENETSTGLGLQLCHDLIMKNNGRVWVESAEGRGSTFNFSLPKAKI